MIGKPLARILPLKSLDAFPPCRKDVGIADIEGRLAVQHTLDALDRGGDERLIRFQCVPNDMRTSK